MFHALDNLTSATSDAILPAVSHLANSLEGYLAIPYSAFRVFVAVRQTCRQELTWALLSACVKLYYVLLYSCYGRKHLVE